MQGYLFRKANTECIVGNGKTISRTRLGATTFVFNRMFDEINLLFDQKPGREFGCDTFVRPGNITYTVPGKVAVRYACDPADDLYLIHITSLASESMLVEVYAAGEGVGKSRKQVRSKEGVMVAAGSRHSVDLVDGKGYIRTELAAGGTFTVFIGKTATVKGHPKMSAPTLIEAWERHYRTKGLQLRTPDEKLNLAVDFMKYHQQLGFDWPDKMVCDIFRWRDVWSRDFGSGFGPGAIVANLYEGVEKTLEYELERHARANPGDWKVSDDTSQGGSIEGLGWLMKIIWRYYKHTGDKDFLGRMYAAFQPWIDHWIDRDADDDGLVVDVTEWMDHSRYLRLPEGQRTLYANALYRAALRRFGYAAKALGRADDAERYSELADKTRTAIQSAFWNEAGYFNNAVFWGVADTALMLADNCIALMERVATRNESFRTLSTLKERNWRNYGSVTVDVPMKYVGPENDQNVMVWPWWMALEAKARFIYGDRDGAIHLIRKCIDSLEWPTFPGLMEEYFHPDDGSQDDVVGHAFITGAGAVLDALMYGLVGLSHVEPGDKVIRLAPRAPISWDRWSAVIDLYQGSMTFEKVPDAYRIHTENTRMESLLLRIPPKQGVEFVEVDGVVIEPDVIEDEEGGAIYLKFSLKPGSAHSIEVNFLPPALYTQKLRMPDSLPHPLRVKAPALLDDPRLFADILQGFINNSTSYFGEMRPVAARDLREIGADLLTIVGNELPFETKMGESVQDLMDGYIRGGGSLLLLGPRSGTVDPHTDGQMGERSGLFWWKKWIDGRWCDYDPHRSELVDGPVHRGTVYWGDGPLFRAWEHQYGMFGFEKRCRGVFDVAGNPIAHDMNVEILYTDFTVHKPWQFYPLAFSERADPVVTGPRPERYPCAVLLHNTETDSRIVLVAPSLCSRADVLHRIMQQVYVR